jgi:hypothetical protein
MLPTFRRCVQRISTAPAISNTAKRFFADNVQTSVHFKKTATPHPFMMQKYTSAETTDATNDALMKPTTQNHIWSEAELAEAMGTLYHHKPTTIGDHIVRSLMYGLYHTFNFVTGYKAENPSVHAIEWRLIVLESVAGVPGFLAAAVRHFRSLRSLERDHGWIATLLEEAENERMHLLICLNTFNANLPTRAMVIAAQMLMVPGLLITYLIKPSAVHRFVGYLEETACKTYVNVIKHVEIPGTQLNAKWANMAAPAIAIKYYKLPADAKWVDTLKCMMADEAHHRDVNHTFAGMKSSDANPFLQLHKENAIKAWRLHETGETAWRPNTVPAKGVAATSKSKEN